MASLILIYSIAFNALIVKDIRAFFNIQAGGANAPQSPLVPSTKSLFAPPPPMKSPFSLNL